MHDYETILLIDFIEEYFSLFAAKVGEEKAEEIIYILKKNINL